MFKNLTINFTTIFVTNLIKLFRHNSTLDQKHVKLLKGQFLCTSTPNKVWIQTVQEGNNWRPTQHRADIPKNFPRCRENSSSALRIQNLSHILYILFICSNFLFSFSVKVYVEFMLLLCCWNFHLHHDLFCRFHWSKKRYINRIRALIYVKYWYFCNILLIIYVLQVTPQKPKWELKYQFKWKIFVWSNTGLI